MVFDESVVELLNEFHVRIGHIGKKQQTEKGCSHNQNNPVPGHFFLLLSCPELFDFKALHKCLHSRAKLSALTGNVGAVDGEHLDAVVAGHYLTCDDALIRPVGAELHLLINGAVRPEIPDELSHMVIAVFDPVQSALTGALSVLQVPAADLRECVLGIGELYLLSAGEGAVAVAVGDHQCAAALDELDELGIVDLRADNDNADTVLAFTGSFSYKVARKRIYRKSYAKQPQ